MTERGKPLRHRAEIENALPKSILYRKVRYLEQKMLDYKAGRLKLSEYAFWQTRREVGEVQETAVQQS